MAVVEALVGAAGVEYDGVGVGEKREKPCGGDGIEGVVCCRQRHFRWLLLL